MMTIDRDVWVVWMSGVLLITMASHLWPAGLLSLPVYILWSLSLGKWQENRDEASSFQNDHPDHPQFKLPCSMGRWEFWHTFTSTGWWANWPKPNTPATPNCARFFTGELGLLQGPRGADKTLAHSCAAPQIGGLSDGV